MDRCAPRSAWYSVLPLTHPEELPLVDDFGTDVPGGRVISTATRTGHVRHGTDEERVMSVDHGGLRIKPLVRPAWGRSELAYGPFIGSEGLASSVVFLNGRNGSENLDPWPSLTHWTKQWIRGTQSDGPAQRMLSARRFPNRDRLTRRWQAARSDARRSPSERSDVNLAVSWSSSSPTADPLGEPSVVVRSAGPENAELCLADSGRVRPVEPLRELLMRVVFLHTGGMIAVFLATDDEAERWPAPSYLGALKAPVGRPGWLSIQQRTLGQVGWGMDTRVKEVRIEQLTEYPSVDELEAGAELVLPCPIPSQRRRLDDPIELTGRFGVTAPDLAGCTTGGRTWRHAVGKRRMHVSDDSAVVGDSVPVASHKLARLVRPSGQRTAYVLDWDGHAGSIATEITPPGTERGEGHAGRGGLILFQDPDNYFIVNNWLDDEYGGASVSAFRRLNGHEEVFDAVWTNVGQMITWGRRHELALGFDTTGFTAYVDGVAVLGKEFSDVYPSNGSLQVNAVGICTNWEFGDDTGSRFHSFTARRHPGR